ncbi:hypothetical protein [Amycolatopsis sp. NPDC051128]|uniref:hypothetical protein n=1 Tax=Amycolatopsis sp. NPDC051128 TaxID=3155412 RepID=UPI0034216E4D
MKNPTLRRVLVVTTAVSASLGGGIAVAAWTSSGSGAATAKATTASAPTTGTASAITSGLLYPGATGTAKLLVNNPNPYPVVVTRVAAGTGAPTGSGGIGTCTTTGVSWQVQTPQSAVPAGGSTTLTLTDAVAMGSTVDDGCQGAVFSIPVVVTVASS